MRCEECVVVKKGRKKESGVERKRRKRQVNRPEAKKPRVIGYAARIGFWFFGAGAVRENRTEQSKEGARRRGGAIGDGEQTLKGTAKGSKSPLWDRPLA